MTASAASTAPAPITVHGIPNCDTVKRARAWLAEQGLAAAFHDFKKAGLPPPLLDGWIDALGWEPLLNRKGTTWRQLDEATRAGVVDAASARAVMLAQPSVVKRPVVAWPDGVLTVGFDPALFARRAG
jgi:arsenate reductase